MLRLSAGGPVCVNGRVVSASGELSGVLYQDCCHSCCLKSYLLNSD